MVKIAKALEECFEILKHTEDARFEAYVLAQHVLKMDKLMLRLHSEDEIEDELFRKLTGYARRRANGEPSAYITGCREFMSLDFKVNRSVLIPRPDTETLVEAIIGRYKDAPLEILDICTGSGAIACSLAHYMKNTSVVGVDISPEALLVAEENARNTKTSQKVKFTCADALNLPGDLGRFDVVVSNPPYIETDVISALDSTVRDYEPLLALDGGHSGLVFYEAITSGIERCLKKGGELYFEIGCSQAEDVCRIMNDKFEKIEVLKDLSGNDRVVFGQLV